MEQNLGSAWSIYKEAFQLYRANLGAIIALVSIPAVIYLASEVLLAQDATELAGGLVTLVYAISSIISMLVLMMILIGRSPTFKDASRGGLRLFLPLVLVGLLSTFTVLGGAVLLIIPGIYVGILLSMWTYILVLENKRGIAGLVQSWYLVKGSWWNVFKKQLLLLLGILVSMAAFSAIFTIPAMLVADASVFVGTFEDPSAFENISQELFTLYVATPFALLFGSILYRRLKTAKPGEYSAEDASKVRRNIMLLAGLAAAITIFFAIFIARGFISLLNLAAW